MINIEELKLGDYVRHVGGGEKFRFVFAWPNEEDPSESCIELAFFNNDNFYMFSEDFDRYEIVKNKCQKN